MKSLQILALLVCGFASNAFAKPEYLQNYCDNSANIENIKLKAMDYRNTLSFRNQGGIGGKGVCWWHSRFQRNALYLAVFRPEVAEDSESTVKAKIRRLRFGKEVIVFNGFANLYELSAKYDYLIQRELEKWQKSDGIVKFKWVQGLRGKPELEASQMREMLDDLYERVVTRKQITYQKLQFKGITAHAWLVVDMERTANGYRLYVIDSLIPNNIEVYDYTQGMTSFYYPITGQTFAPRTEFSNETSDVISVMKYNCNN